MRHFIIAAAAAAALTASLGAAEAMPVAPAGELAAAPAITLVSGGCGPFRHRGPFGGCRPNFGPRPFYGRPFHRYGHPFYGHPYGWRRHYY